MVPHKTIWVLDVSGPAVGFQHLHSGNQSHGNGKPHIFRGVAPNTLGTRGCNNLLNMQEQLPIYPHCGWFGATLL